MKGKRSPRVCVVGAGFAGSVAARVLADLGADVVVVEKRPHIGGNAFDEYDPHGVLIHTYGPHIFHTNSGEVYEFLSRFTSWNPYQHRVRAKVGDQLVPIPVNRTTLNLLYGLKLETDEDAAEFLERVREKDRPLINSEDVVLSRVGRDLCENLFSGYTRKQWGRELRELGPEVAGRIPTRTNEDERYFEDTYQVMPAEGYTVMFENMLTHRSIHVELGQDFFEKRVRARFDHIVFTGRLDEWFGFCFGRLPYRSLRFEHIHFPDIHQYQPVAVVNYPNECDFTRLTEFKHLTGQRIKGTSIVREYALDEGDPYYPIPVPEAKALAGRYRKLARSETNVTFLGRLAQYRYLNMDQVVASALTKAVRIARKMTGN